MLQLHDKWSKALDPNDLYHYEKLFSDYQKKQLQISARVHSEQSLKITPLMKAFNHKKQLLLTCFITNQSSEPQTITDCPIIYIEQNHQLSANMTIHHFSLKPQQTTIWTIIFNQHPFDIKKEPTFLLE